MSLRIPDVPGQPADAVVVLQLQPRRLGIPDDDPERVLDELATLVDQGLRAQLATGNLLTGSLVVKLIDDDTQPEASLDRTSRPYPRPADHDVQRGGRDARCRAADQQPVGTCR